MTAMIEVTVDKLSEAIKQYKTDGYRLDMIRPADNPREAIMSVPPAVAGGLAFDTSTTDVPRLVHLKLSKEQRQPPATAGGTDKAIDNSWHVGRAGMMYRDLIPDRIGGKVIASQIRLLEDGPVADFVHYHKVEFQMIYCLKGRIKVVYEDQGPPFWLEPGDCVVQPPEIRHRVLFAEGAAEVLEVSIPAEHETWLDHEMVLPNESVNKDREFMGQRFVFTKAP